MDWNKVIKPSEFDKKICHTFGVTIEPITENERYRIVYKDPECKLFKRPLMEAKKPIYKEQINFELMMSYRKTSELIIKKFYK